jgi:hypothetical protein
MDALLRWKGRIDLSHGVGACPSALLLNRRTSATADRPFAGACSVHVAVTPRRRSGNDFRAGRSDGARAAGHSARSSTTEARHADARLHPAGTRDPRGMAAADAAGRRRGRGLADALPGVARECHGRRRGERAGRAGDRRLRGSGLDRRPHHVLGGKGRRYRGLCVDGAGVLAACRAGVPQPEAVRRGAGLGERAALHPVLELRQGDGRAVPHRRVRTSVRQGGGGWQQR